MIRLTLETGKTEVPESDLAGGIADEGVVRGRSLVDSVVILSHRLRLESSERVGRERELTAEG